MAYISAVPEESATGAVAEIYELDRQTAGYVPNFTRTFSHRPEVYLAWKALNGAVKQSMDLRRYELATVAAAAALRSSYCSLAHGRVLAQQFMPAEDVAALAVASASAELPASLPADGALEPVDRAVVAFAQKIALHADRITAADVDELRSHGLSDADVLDVVLAASVRCFFSKTLEATGTEADVAFLDLPDGLREALTVGRPIAGR
jgi:uncharacterized peroxidase-related enzyme